MRISYLVSGFVHGASGPLPQLVYVFCGPNVVCRGSQMRHVDPRVTASQIFSGTKYFQN